MDKTRHDDSALIDAAEDAAAFGGASGGNLAREVGARAETEDELGDAGTTRVHGEDKPREGDRPNLPNRD
jgi:hypothetical protein